MEPQEGIMLGKAIDMAVEAHANMFDKSGCPDILHPIAVMMKCETPEEKIVGILHDIIEDTDITLENIESNFPHDIFKAVDAISRRDGETYKDYILRVKRNYLARRVKLKDLEHNNSMERLCGLPEKNLSLSKRYVLAYKELTTWRLFK